MTTQKKVNNALYVTTHQVGAGTLKQVAWYFTSILFIRNPLVVGSGIRVFLLRLFGARIGTGVVIKPSVNIKYPWKLVVGNHCWIGEGVWIDNLSNVSMGESVTLSQGALVLTGSHDHTRESFDFISYPVVLENGVWIGAKAVVYGGVTCRTHAILGINAVAETNLEAYTIYKGNPAVPVLKREIR
jgi:putative colanic acid biosynthesis acetyltransferase WcaF